ncbi:MAG: hypothetical protein ACRCY8_02115 [Dermatophilaceae bacterium]
MPGPFLDAATPAVFDRDIDAIRQAAADLGATAVPIIDGGEAVVRTWRGVDPHYVAPESPVLVAALDPLLAEAKQVGDGAADAGRILRAWADDAEPLVTEGRALADTAAGMTQDLREAQAMRLTQILVELSLLDDQCARDLAALVPDAPLTVLPPRVRVGQSVMTSGAQATVGFGQFGYEFRVVESRFNDGYVEFTVVNQGGLTGIVGLGPAVAAGQAELEARAELIGGVTLANGNTWLVEPGKVEEFRALLNAYLGYRQARLATSGGLPMAAGQILGDVLAPLPFLPPPTRVDTTVELPVELNGGLDATSPGSPAVGTAGSVGANPQWTGRRLADGSTVSVFGGEAVASGELNRFGESSGVGGSVQDNVAVTRDPGGQVTRVVLTSTTELEQGHEVGRRDRSDAPAGRDPHEASAGFSDDRTAVDVTTTTLDVDDTNRAVVEQWLAENSGDPLGSIGEGDRFYPRTASEGDPFQNVLHTDATVTRVRHDNVTDGSTLGGVVSVGPGLGAEVGDETTTGQVAGGTYLDRPDIHGNRVERPLPGVPD